MAAPNTNVPAAVTSASVVAAIVGPTITKVTPHVEKPQQFNGKDFKRWQQKIIFHLTILNLAHILKESCPVTLEGDVMMETQATKEA